MDRWHSLADQKIREAMDQGQFRNLAGQGRPQKLEWNPYEPPELHMAHTILEAAGMSPAWVQERREIDDAVEDATSRLAAMRGTDGWHVAVDDFRKTAAALNSRILTYNLSVPSGGFQRMQLDAEHEIRRAARGEARPSPQR
jgi:hypothetical protein